MIGKFINIKTNHTILILLIINFLLRLDQREKTNSTLTSFKIDFFNTKLYTR